MGEECSLCFFSINNNEYLSFSIIVFLHVLCKCNTTKRKTHV